MSSDTGVDVPEEAFVGEKVADDIADLFSAGGASEDEPEAEETVEEEPKPEVESKEDEGHTEPDEGEVHEEEQEEATGEAAVPTETGGGTEEEAEAPVEELTEIEGLRRSNAALMDMLERHSAGLPFVDVTSTDGSVAEPVGAPTLPVVPISQTIQPPQESPQQVQAPEPIELTPELYEHMISATEGGRQAFAAYVNYAASTHATNELQRVRQQLMQEQATITSRQVQTSRDMERFFESDDNADLGPMMKFVQQTAVEVEAQNPHLSVTEVLSTAAQLVREKVGGSVAIGSTGSKLVRRTKPKAPQFAKPTSARKPASVKKPMNAQTALEDEIYDILS